MKIIKGRERNIWPFPITYEEYMQLDESVKTIINGAMLAAVASSRAEKKNSSLKKPIFTLVK